MTKARIKVLINYVFVPLLAIALLVGGLRVYYAMNKYQSVKSWVGVNFEYEYGLRGYTVEEVSAHKDMYRFAKELYPDETFTVFVIQYANIDIEEYRIFIAITVYSDEAFLFNNLVESKNVEIMLTEVF